MAIKMMMMTMMSLHVFIMFYAITVCIELGKFQLLKKEEVNSMTVTRKTMTTARIMMMTTMMMTRRMRLTMRTFTILITYYIHICTEFGKLWLCFEEVKMNKMKKITMKKMRMTKRM